VVLWGPIGFYGVLMGSQSFPMGSDGVRWGVPWGLKGVLWGPDGVLMGSSRGPHVVLMGSSWGLDGVGTPPPPWKESSRGPPAGGVCIFTKQVPRGPEAAKPPEPLAQPGPSKPLTRVQKAFAAKRPVPTSAAASGKWLQHFRTPHNGAPLASLAQRSKKARAELCLDPKENAEK